MKNTTDNDSDTSVSSGANPRSDAKTPGKGATMQRREPFGMAPEPAGKGPEPRLPNERDESADQQNADHARPVIAQGHADLAAGQQDTGKKPAMEGAYEAQKGQGAPGTAAAAPDRSGAGRDKTGEAGGPGDRKSSSVG